MLLVLNAGYYGLTILPFPDAKNGSPEEYPCAQSFYRGVPGKRWVSLTFPLRLLGAAVIPAQHKYGKSIN